jgi:hypothetical protein
MDARTRLEKAEERTQHTRRGTEKQRGKANEGSDARYMDTQDSRATRYNIHTAKMRTLKEKSTARGNDMRAS